jgi:transcriptional regulator with XRE-family HTH domain
MKTAPLEGRFKQNGAKIRRARRSTGQSQEIFAERIGTTRRHMIRLEKGHHLPSGALRDRIVKETKGAVDGIEAHDDEDDEEDAAVSFDDFLRRRVRALMREETEA